MNWNIYNEYVYKQCASFFIAHSTVIRPWHIKRCFPALLLLPFMSSGLHLLLAVTCSSSLIRQGCQALPSNDRLGKQVSNAVAAVERLKPSLELNSGLCWRCYWSKMGQPSGMMMCRHQGIKGGSNGQRKVRLRCILGCHKSFVCL